MRAMGTMGTMGTILAGGCIRLVPETEGSLT